MWSHGRTPSEPGVSGLVHVIRGMDELAALAGRGLGVSQWHRVTQEQIDAFAEVTGDAERLHLDPAVARERGFDNTIAHGLLTVSLGPMLVAQVFRAPGIRLSLNYGFDRVRLTAPVPVGSRVRLHLSCESVEPIRGGLKCTFGQTFELEGETRPACVAQSVIAFLE